MFPWRFLVAWWTDEIHEAGGGKAGRRNSQT